MIPSNEKEKLVNELADAAADFSKPPGKFKKVLDSYFEERTAHIAALFTALAQRSIETSENKYADLAKNIQANGVSYIGLLSNSKRAAEELAADYREVIRAVGFELRILSGEQRFTVNHIEKPSNAIHRFYNDRSRYYEKEKLRIKRVEDIRSIIPDWSDCSETLSETVIKDTAKNISLEALERERSSYCGYKIGRP